MRTADEYGVESSREHKARVMRVIRAQKGATANDQIIHIEGVIADLWRALDEDEDTSIAIGLIEKIYAAATGRIDDNDARRLLIWSISVVATWSDAQYGRRLLNRVPRKRKAKDKRRSANATDEQLAGLVRLQWRRYPAHAERLRSDPSCVARAVRLWRRGPGRPRFDAPSGSKWAAVAEVIKLAGLGAVDEKAVEQFWKRQAPK